MGGVLFRRDERRERYWPLAARSLYGDCTRTAAGGIREIECPFATPAQFKISHRQKLGVEQRAVQHAVLDRNVEALADSIERCGRTGTIFLRQHQRVDEPVFRQRRTAEQFQLVVEEAAVEFRVVRDDGIIAEEFHQAINHVRMLEPLLVAQCLVGDAGDAHGRFRHGPAGVDVDLEFAASRQVVAQFDATDLYDAVARSWIEAGGFGVEDDFPHVSSCSVAARIRVRSASMISSICASA